MISWRLIPNMTIDNHHVHLETVSFSICHVGSLGCINALCVSQAPDKSASPQKEPASQSKMRINGLLRRRKHRSVAWGKGMGMLFVLYKKMQDPTNYLYIYIFIYQKNIYIYIFLWCRIVVHKSAFLYTWYTRIYIQSYKSIKWIKAFALNIISFSTAHPPLNSKGGLVSGSQALVALTHFMPLLAIRLPFTPRSTRNHYGQIILLLWQRWLFNPVQRSLETTKRWFD